MQRAVEPLPMEREPSCVSAYVQSRVGVSYADLLQQLGRKQKSALATLQQLSYFACDEQVVTPLVKCKWGRATRLAHCLSGWQCLQRTGRCGQPSTMSCAARLQSLPATRRCLRCSTRRCSRICRAPIRLRALWPCGPLCLLCATCRPARTAVQPLLPRTHLYGLPARRRHVSAKGGFGARAYVCASVTDSWFQYVALSACHTLGAAYQSQTRALVPVEPIVACLSCADGVGARLALKFLLDRVRADLTGTGARTPCAVMNRIR